MLIKVFSRKWLPTTILVIVAMGVMARLGLWQLDRLEKRRAFNSRVLSQQSQPVLELQGETLDLDLTRMEYRQVFVRGQYLPEHEIALRNQFWQNQWGVHLITPLRIAGSERVVLVDRGWIPAQDFENGDWAKYSEPGIVEVRGVIRVSQEKADFGSRRDPTPAPGGAPVKAWYFVNVEQIAVQVGMPLLPVYIQQAPDLLDGSDEGSGVQKPRRALPELELTEGPHLGYAIQWFTFAFLLGGGYPFFIRKQEGRSALSGIREGNQ